MPCDNELALAFYPRSQSSPAPNPLGWRPPVPCFETRGTTQTRKLRAGSYKNRRTFTIGRGKEFAEPIFHASRAASHADEARARSVAADSDSKAISREKPRGSQSCRKCCVIQRTERLGRSRFTSRP